MSFATKTVVNFQQNPYQLKVNKRVYGIRLNVVSTFKMVKIFLYVFGFVQMEKHVVGTVKKSRGTLG